ncbi:uncharacterized protein LOC100573233 precursor [Acyrthosiphon pisum]|uniref:ACYPI35350 protein n=1 Tax=Acyrthosiphon pisum TaxID=7029 RepID=C4WXE6_ACYPI|nr:uncharacterized protein LOC100573233 precursor [Acyrthosiphon pisum]BAH72566.1 ACYPI35350 [Acyrthosiphon pisum]|eukprot:NP_001232970.1 uncharacterized protein LOC100573233 precursor [Acyrthosiphon pisum]
MAMTYNHCIIILLELIFILNYCSLVKSQCGTDLEVDGLRNYIITVETGLTALAAASAVPGAGVIPTVSSITLATEAGGITYYRLDKMENSLEVGWNRGRYDTCMKIIKEAKLFNSVLRGFGLGVGGVTMIPVIGALFVPVKIGIGVTATATIASELSKWKKEGCVQSTKPCD